MTKEVMKSFKYRIYPSFEQETRINFNIDSGRLVFNAVKEMYECDRDMIQTLLTKFPLVKTKYSINRSVANQYLKELKQIHPLKRMDSIAGQTAYDGLIRGFENIYKTGAGYVRWKSRRNPVQTMKTRNCKNH
ncbi:MAG: helix-turn-helix domain-containing protein [Methanobrevibacter sp.]|jgi:putative transposase|nr:helix-turn-helix domain-containing protein [Candidatus Methanovirga aequatorialis]